MNINTNIPILIEDLGYLLPNENSKQPRKYGIYLCPYCNQPWKAQIYNVSKGITTSCGCITKSIIADKNTKHNLCNHPLYEVWSNMKARCYNKNKKSYKAYGGRGIIVYTEWSESFIAFYNWAIFNGYKKNLTLDRIDVDGNYEPNNCRWVTKSIQAQNRRHNAYKNVSGYRGVFFRKNRNKWIAQIIVEGYLKCLGTYNNPEEAAKAYETYVRLNNLEHNFTPILTDEEILNLKKRKLMNKVYILEGTYHSIEDSSTRSLYVFKTRYMAELYQASIEKTLEEFRELYEKFCEKHDSDYDYRVCLYIERLAKAYKKKKPEFFWLDVFEGLDYYDYLPSFKVKELDFIGEIK